MSIQVQGCMCRGSVNYYSSFSSPLWFTVSSLVFGLCYYALDPSDAEVMCSEGKTQKTGFKTLVRSLVVSSWKVYCNFVMLS